VSDGSDERKERVLHTRVPDSLDRQLKHRARRLGMSVSTVVRHVLLNTFGLVEDIVTDSTNVALALTGGDSSEPAAGSPARTPAPRPGNADSSTVLAWQEAVLNVNAVCAHCNAILRRGVRAAVGIRDAAGAPVVICRRCLERLQNEPTALPARTARR
jgi:hypothetical protein